MKTFTILFLAVALAGCGSVPGIGSSAAPQVSANVAQTARDQSSVPGQSAGGSVYWYFASQGAADIQRQIIAMANEQKWTPEQLVAALASTNGSPDSVVITTHAVQGGDADNAGAGSGSGGAGSGTVGNRP